MDVPSIGRMVIYRHPRGYDVPAVVSATHETVKAALAQEDVSERDIRPLRNENHLHLTVFTPSTAVEGGTEKARDVPPCYPDEPVQPHTWSWPARATPPTVITHESSMAEITEHVNRAIALQSQRSGR